MAEKQVSIMHWSLRRVRELENGNKPPTKIPKKAQLKACVHNVSESLSGDLAYVKARNIREI
jgi:hypothetical protein